MKQHFVTICLLHPERNSDNKRWEVELRNILHTICAEDLPKRQELLRTQLPPLIENFWYALCVKPGSAEIHAKSELWLSLGKVAVWVHLVRLTSHTDKSLFDQGLGKVRTQGLLVMWVSCNFSLEEKSKWKSGTQSRGTLSTGGDSRTGLRTEGGLGGKLG